MATPISSFTGIASGVQYKDLVDAIIAQESAPLNRLTTEKSTANARRTALTSYRGLLDTLRSAARGLRDGSVLDSTTASVQAVTGGMLASVVTSAGVQPASFNLEVSALARAGKFGSGIVIDPKAAQGQTGEFTVNGKTVTVAPADTLEAIRDKINALNTGSSPSKVTASIMKVADGDHRLVLSANDTGANSLVVDDTIGGVLQYLGFLEPGGAVKAAAVLVEGRNAEFEVDGVAMTRASNVVSDVMTGVTITLTAESDTAVNTVTVGRFGDSAKKGLQAFADAYNAVVNFIKQQNTAGANGNPALFGDAMLRSVRGGLPSRMLEAVAGAAGDLATAATVGLSLQRDGTIKFDSARFETAYKERFADVRTLFTERLSASDAEVTFVSGGGQGMSGSWAVDITAAATKGSIVTSGFTGTYDAGATADAIRVTDNKSAKAIDVALTTGMTSAQIKTALEDAFAANGLDLAVTLEGNDLRITHNQFGSAAGVAVAITGGGDGAAEAWTADSASYGTNVAGTIGGLAATGTGDLLVGNAGSTVSGLTARYSGTTARAAGTITLGAGTGAMVERFLDGFIAVGGTITDRESQIDARTARIDGRVNDMTARLERRRTLLLAQFLRMETSVARLQQQSSAFASFNSTSAK